MGNICRSPTAEGVFRHLVDEASLSSRFVIESAGTISYHAGDPPDPRATAAARARGIDLSLQVARQVRDDDFTRFDHILAMDRDNLEGLIERCPAAHEHKLRLFLPIADGLDTDEVPDPYYGGGDGFARVLDLVEAASRALLNELSR
jgi:protein-tyrosine phosphatase